MKPTRILLLTWLAWAVLILGFQTLATSRLVPQFPDRSQEWTTTETKTKDYQQGRPYLLEPFMNNQVAWDSEYYLAIAVGGYDDPRTPHLTPTGISVNVVDHTVSQSGTSFDKSISLSYAFFPFYPLMIRIFAFPLSLLGMNPIATATLAGVIVSALGTLLGMLALFDLTKDSLGENGALRAAFYLIIFPTGFFLLQVYTEGLFVGLAFSCLAMLKRKHLLAAALLGVCATLTRAVGVTLVIPMLVTWFRTGEWMDLDLEWRQIFHQGVPLRPLFHALLAFDYIESNFFGRGFLQFGTAYYLWSEVIQDIAGGRADPQFVAYHLIELAGLILGVTACMRTLKTHPELAWFSLAVVIVSLGSGPIQGMQRYILGAPAVFIALARWGENPVFDRAWTILSILIMGLLAMLFAFNMWVA